MRIRSYTEAVRLAQIAGEDAANKRMRAKGRKVWSAADHDHAAAVAHDIMQSLGFDVVGWLATAGLPRNEPEEPLAVRSAKTRSTKRRRPTKRIPLEGQGDLGL